MNIKTTLGLIIIGTTLLTTDCESNKKTNKTNLEKKATLEKRVEPINKFEINRNGFKASLTLKEVHYTPEHINPNKLKPYKADCNQHEFNVSELKGIKSYKFGYFKDNEFKEINYFHMRHIKRPKEIFNYPHPDISNYHYKFKINKIWREEIKDSYKTSLIVKSVSNKILSNSDLYVFPTKENYFTFEAISQPIVPVWNKGITGQYQKDPNSNKINPKNPYLVLSIKSKSKVDLKK